MADRDHAAAFIRFAAEKRCVRGPRGAFVKLCRWHAPMVGRQHAQALPPLRNRFDARAWAREAGGFALPRGVGAFVSAAMRLWGEFVETLDEPLRAVASALADLDAPARREATHRAVIMAWADAFGDRPVTAAELREGWGVHEAICSAARPGCDPDETITPTIVSRFVRDVAAADVVCDGWRIVGAEPDRHQKIARWRLSRCEGNAPG